jgi:hypothetical protein
MEKMKRSMKTSIRIFDDPTLHQGVKVTMHISKVSVRLYNVCIGPIDHILLRGMTFRNGGCFTSTSGKKTAFYHTYE